MTEKEHVVKKGYDKIAEEYQADRHRFDHVKQLEEFMRQDPAVKHGIMTAELRPFRVSLIQKS